MWKFHHFSIFQILRETKVGNLRSPKSAILTNLEALIFYFCEFLDLLKAKISQKTKIRASENAKMAVFQLTKYPQD